MVSWRVPRPTWCKPQTGTGCVFRTVDLTEGCLLNRGERGGNEKAVVLGFFVFFFPKPFSFLSGMVSNLTLKINATRDSWESF